METVIIMNILTFLAMDDEMSMNILSKYFNNIIKLLINCHPINRKTIHFHDISIDETDEKPIFDLELYCLQLLRHLFSIEKNRKVFKSVFPPKIFGIFIDIGNFVKNLNNYESMANEFNKLNVNRKK